MSSILAEGVAQGGAELASAADGERHVLDEEFDHAAPGGLGVVKRHVGGLEQGRGLAVVGVAGEDGRADAGADAHGLALDLVGRAQRADQRRAELGDGFAPRGFEQDDEFVAAEPGDESPRADHVAHARRRLRQQQVADVMAVGVVDLLEPVEVDRQQRKPVAAGSRMMVLSSISLKKARLARPVTGSNRAMR